ncbi:MAG: T9SS C-terminal target domain-containing protein [Bacteroidetes bacterium]|nr:MAG: T9SS C-terminal target domain-containing protein [Bacteroidota bacterium]
MENMYKSLVSRLTFLWVSIVWVSGVTVAEARQIPLRNNAPDVTTMSYNPLQTTTENIDGYKVARGIRPPIDLDRVPKEAYEEGKVHVRFKTEAKSFLPEGKRLMASEKGYVESGHPDMDTLSKSYGIESFTPLLYGLYEKSPESEANASRHKAWGFDLWYELKFDEKSDVISFVKALMALEMVHFAEPVYRIGLVKPVGKPQFIGEEKNSDKRWTPNDPFYAANQWHYNNTGQFGGTPGVDIKLPGAWNIQKGNPNILVAIVDDGVQYNHPDLQANIWPGIGPEGTSTVAGNHGTHVAGTVAAVTNNNTGLAGVAGGSGNGDGVRMMSVDLLEGNHGLSHLALYTYQANNGVSISQNSWGYLTPGFYNQSTLDGIDYFNANGGGTAMNGGLVIFAAGNDNSNAAWYPAVYPGAVAVASYDFNGIKSDFSNYGPWIDITGPGTDVASTFEGSNYGFLSGTSMACPHVSGVGALILSHLVGQVTLTPMELYNLMIQNVDNIYQANPNYTGMLGAGGLNAHAALLAANALVDDNGGGDPNQIVVFSEDFAGSFPAGWQNNVIAPAGFPGFEWTNTGGDYGGQLNSTTAANGYLILDSDGHGTEGVNENVELITPAINFAQHGNLTSITFSLEHLARTFGNADIAIYISANNFATQTLLYEWKNAPVNSYNSENNPLVSTFDITSIAQGQNNVKIKFRWLGQYDYWWLIDDVKITALQDGGGNGGDLQLFVDQPVEPVENNKSAVVSANRSNINYEVADNFANVNGDVEKIVVYGLYAIFQNNQWNNVEPGNNLNFNVRFYNPSATAPNWNNPVAQYLNVQTTSITAETPWNNGFNVWRFELDIPPTAVSNGWVSVQSSGGNGWFLWHSSSAGDSFSSQINHNNKSGHEPESYPSFIGKGPHQKNDALDHDVAMQIWGSTSSTPVFNLSLQANPANGGTVAGGGQYEAGQQVSVSATANSGFTFQNWTNSTGSVISTAPAFSFTMPASHTTLTANFSQGQPTEYTLTLVASPSNGGTVSGGGQYPSGQQVTISANANANFEFVAWRDGNFTVSTQSTYTFNMPVGNLTLTAVFQQQQAPDTWQLTLSSQPSGAGTLAGAGNYQAGEQILVSATAHEGYTFLNWRQNGSILSNQPDFIFNMPSSNVTLTAHFNSSDSPLYNLTLEASPAHGGSVSGSGQYAAGAEILIMATPASGFSFLRWFRVGGAMVSTQAEFIYTMPQSDVTLRAFFENPTHLWEGTSEETKVFPNPASEFVSIENPNIINLIEVYDLTGRLMVSHTPDSETYQLRVNALKAGPYILKITDNQGVTVKKIQVYH